MKHFFIALFFVAFSGICNAQYIRNEGAKIHVASGTGLVFNSLYNTGSNGSFYYNAPLNVPGNWINVTPAVFSEGASGTVTFNGSTTQQIACAGSTFGTVTVNNNSGDDQAVVLNDNMEIESSLTLTNGIVDAGANTLVFQSTATSNSGNALSFVDGEMQKTGATAFVFPGGDVSLRDIGDGNLEYRIWAPIRSNPVGSTVVSVEYFFDNAGMPDWWEHGGNMDPDLHHVSDREYWLVSSTENFTNTTLYWNDNGHAVAGVCEHGFDDGNPAAFNTGDLSVAYWNGSMWVDAGAGGTSSIVHDNGYLASSDVIPFGAKSQTFVTFGSKDNINPLPVELISFNADCYGNKVDIVWQTASEINNAGFSIEKSNDGKSFVQIGFVGGAGNSNSLESYSYTDNKPGKGTTYYRLKQIDTDGKYVYSKAIYASCDDQNEIDPSFIVYPNPTNDIINISAENLPDEDASVSIYNMIGSLVWQSKLNAVSGMAFTRFDMSDLPPAMYLVKVISGDYVGVKKVENR